MAEQVHRRGGEPKPRGRTGPRSRQGKARASRNATTHGCTSERLILPDEKIEDWNALFQEWLDDYEPDCPTFTDLVRRAAEADWFLRRNLKRYNEAEQKLHEQQPDLFVWTDEQHKLLDRFLRYRTAAERVFYRARGAVEQAWKARFSEGIQLKNQAIKEAGIAEKKAKAAADAAADDEDSDDDEKTEKKKVPFADYPVMQHARVSIVDGKTRTYVGFTNERVINAINRRREEGGTPLEVRRFLDFDCDTMPPEYEWVLPLMKEIGLEFPESKSLMFKLISDEQFLYEDQKEKDAATGHWVKW